MTNRQCVLVIKGDFHARTFVAFCVADWCALGGLCGGAAAAANVEKAGGGHEVSRLDMADLKQGEVLRGARAGKRFRTVTLSDQILAVADAGLIAGDQAYSVSPSGVDIAWSKRDNVSAYRVFRDGHQVASLGGLATGYTDHGARPNATYQYKIVASGDGNDETLPYWGFDARVPEGDTLKGAPMTTDDARRAERVMTSSAAAEVTATIAWKAFVAEDFIPVPTLAAFEPCGYDSSYSFSGDNRSWDFYSGKNRTHLQATIHWRDRTVTQGAWTGVTEVWRNGRQVAGRQASNGAMRAVKAANTPPSYVDVRFNFSASNTFCKLDIDLNKISGSMIIRLTPGGSYSILQGSHRRMPAHQIYISRPAVTDVYRASAYSPNCLIGTAACPDQSFTRSGKF